MHRAETIHIHNPVYYMQSPGTFLQPLQARAQSVYQSVSKSPQVERNDQKEMARIEELEKEWIAKKASEERAKASEAEKRAMHFANQAQRIKQYSREIESNEEALIGESTHNVNAYVQEIDRYLAELEAVRRPLINRETTLYKRLSKIEYFYRRKVANGNPVQLEIIKLSNYTKELNETIGKLMKLEVQIDQYKKERRIALVKLTNRILQIQSTPSREQLRGRQEVRAMEEMLQSRKEAEEMQKAKIKSEADCAWEREKERIVMLKETMQEEESVVYNYIVNNILN